MRATRRCKHADRRSNGGTLRAKRQIDFRGATSGRLCRLPFITNSEITGVAIVNLIGNYYSTVRIGVRAFEPDSRRSRVMLRDHWIPPHPSSLFDHRSLRRWIGRWFPRRSRNCEILDFRDCRRPRRSFILMIRAFDHPCERGIRTWRNRPESPQRVPLGIGVVR